MIQVKEIFKNENLFDEKSIFIRLINIIKIVLFIMIKEHLLGLIEYYLKKIKISSLYFMILLSYIFLTINF